MEYDRDTMTFEKGPIIKVSGVTDFSVHVPLDPPEEHHIDFECAKCGYSNSDFPIEHDVGDDVYFFQCPKCHLRYNASHEGKKMKVYTRWMELRETSNE